MAAVSALFFRLDLRRLRFIPNGHGTFEEVSVASYDVKSNKRKDGGDSWRVILRDYRRTLEEVSEWCGHHSLDITWNTYRNKKTVLYFGPSEISKVEDITRKVKKRVQTSHQPSTNLSLAYVERSFCRNESICLHTRQSLSPFPFDAND